MVTGVYSLAAVYKGYYCERPDHAIFMEDCGRLWEFLVGAWKSVMLKAVWNIEAQLKRFQWGVILTIILILSSNINIRLENILVILTKIIAAFCPCPKNLPEAKFKRNWQRIVQDSLMLTLSCMLVISLRHIYNEKEQVGQKK